MQTGDDPPESNPWPGPLGHLRSLVAELRTYPAPFTTWLVGVVAIVFAGQVVLAIEVGASIQLVTGALFLEYPEAMWLLSPLLHRDLLHVGVNAVFLGLLGTVNERHFTPLQYLGFLAVAAAVSSILAFAAQAPFTEKHVAAYGASGMVIALSTYSLGYTHLRLPLSLYDLADVFFGAPTPATRLAVVVGISSLVLVAVDLLSPPYFAPNWVNGAHLGGAIVGLLVGRLRPPSPRQIDEFR